MNSEERKAALLCIAAFVVGCLVFLSGCQGSRRVLRVQSPIHAQMDVGLQPPVIDLGKPQR